MSTAPEFLERLAEAAPMHAGTLYSYFVALRAGGLIPRDRRGPGDTNRIHLTAEQLVWPMLGIGAPSPSLAAKHARLFGELWPDDAGVSLHAFLSLEVSNRARRLLVADVDYLDAPTGGWELSLGLNPVHARMHWTNENGLHQRHYWPRPPRSTFGAMPAAKHVWPGLRRTSVISLELINMAAECFADTLRHNENAALAGAAPNQSQQQQKPYSTSGVDSTGDGVIRQALAATGSRKKSRSTSRNATETSQ